MHKPVRYKFKWDRVVVGSIDEEWEADLVIMKSLSKENSGYTKYLLAVIAVLSKFAWVEPITTKGEENVLRP